MSIVQAILLGVLYWIGEANLPFVGLWTVQRPLVCGWIAGIILGDALTGAMVGAPINLVYLGFISAGGSMPADMALAGTLGAAFAITGNLDADTALALAVPIGLLGTLVWYCRMTFDSIFVHIGDRFVEKEQNLDCQRTAAADHGCGYLYRSLLSGCIFRSHLYSGLHHDACRNTFENFPDHRRSDACLGYRNHTAVYL